MFMITIYEAVFRLLLGAVIGGIIGLEREVHGRAAGFRTQLIVCVAAVLIMIISENFYFYMQHINPSVRIDPARIAAGAIMGIGFLGAGVIVKSGFAIRGLTTAASIWIVSAIGLSIGGGMYIEGLTAFLITVLALVVLRMVEKRINTLEYKFITISTQSTEETAEEQITSLFLKYGINIHSVDYESDRVRKEFVYNFNISTNNRKALREVFSKLTGLEFIKSIKIDGQDKLAL